MTIGDRIKMQRTKLDITPDELADKLGKSRATIYRYENGDIKNLPTTILEPLAKALHTTPAYLMGWTDDPHDWEQIGNDNGISLPKEYEGNYEEYVKSKMNEYPDEAYNELFHIPSYNINEKVQVLQRAAEEEQLTDEELEDILSYAKFRYPKAFKNE